VKKIYRTKSLLIISRLRDLLVNEQIPCVVRPPLVAAATGEIPRPDSWSELWIMNDEDYEKAIGVITPALPAFELGPEPTVFRKCPKGHDIEGPSGVCWLCDLEGSRGDA